MKKIISFLFLYIILFSCKKPSNTNNNSSKVPEPPVDYEIVRNVKIYLKDKLNDTSLYNRSKKYGDSLQLFVSQNNSAFANKETTPNGEFPNFYIQIPYIYVYVNKGDNIKDYMFGRNYAIKWNSKETDSLRFIKDNETEIRIYKNGVLERTIDAQDDSIYSVTFYR